MATFTITKHVAAPCDDVFRAFTDFAHLPDHINDIKKIEVLTEGDVGIGTRFRETRVMFGREAAEEFEVVEFEAGKRFKLQGLSCGCRFEATHQFAPEGEGTRVTFQMDTTALSFFAKLMTPVSWMMTGTMKKCVDKDFEELKTVVEKQHNSETAAS